MNLQEKQEKWEATKASHLKEMSEMLVGHEKRRREYNEEFSAWRARMAARRKAE